MADLPDWVEEIQEKHRAAHDIAASEAPTCECEMCQYARANVSRLIHAAAAMAEALRAMLERTDDHEPYRVSTCRACGQTLYGEPVTYCAWCVADLARAALAEYHGDQAED